MHGSDIKFLNNLQAITGHKGGQTRRLCRFDIPIGRLQNYNSNNVHQQRGTPVVWQGSMQIVAFVKNC